MRQAKLDETTTTIGARVTRDEHERIRTLALRRGERVSDMLRTLVALWVEASRLDGARAQHLASMPDDFWPMLRGAVIIESTRRRLPDVPGAILWDRSLGGLTSAGGQVVMDGQDELNQLENQPNTNTEANTGAHTETGAGSNAEGS